jgi:UDP-N-acetylmuramoyl-tripeptide--D-alanyl-D-alanine ligase
MSGNDLNLKQFIKDYPEVSLSSGMIDDIDYQNFSIDSRTLQPGQFFIPLKGENFDGHEFVPDVIEKKAKGIVVQSDWYSQRNKTDFPKELAIIAVENTLDFLQKLSAWHRSHFNVPIIAITGSNGKTTTRKMIVEILSNKFAVLSNEGNQNNHIGVPLTLLSLRPDYEMAVIELGSNHPGEIALLTELVNPGAGVITNIGKSHIGYFGSLEAIYKEKIALFEKMRSGSVIFLNMEDPYLCNYKALVKTIRVGTSDNYEYWGKVVSMDELGCIKISINNLIEIELKIPGILHFNNALMATAIGLHFDIAINEIKEALENFQSANQRMQVYSVNGVLIINDAYNANPDSTRAAIDYLSGLSSVKGRKIIAIGDMLELGNFGEREHLLIGKFISEKSIDLIFLFGPLSVKIKEGLFESDSFKGEAYWYETQEEIVDHLKKILAPNDALLVKGSRGMKMENILNNLFSKN